MRTHKHKKVVRFLIAISYVGLAPVLFVAAALFRSISPLEGAVNFDMDRDLKGCVILVGCGLAWFGLFRGIALVADRFAAWVELRRRRRWPTPYRAV